MYDIPKQHAMASKDAVSDPHGSEVDLASSQSVGLIEVSTIGIVE